MNSCSTPAVVLKTLPRGEDDLSCDLMTLQFGRIWGLARSARKSRKRFGTTLAPLNILQVRLGEKKGLPFFTLLESNLTVPLNHIQNEVERIESAFYMVQAIRESTPENLPEPQKFELLVDELKALDRGEPAGGVRRDFEKRFLKISGYEPHLTNCVRCGRQEDIYYFVFSQGAVFCSGCLPPEVSFQKVAATAMDRIFTPFLEYCIGKRFRVT